MLEELTPAQERFAVWLATPEGDRKPGTYEEMAKTLGVSESTIYRWRRHPSVKARAQEIVDEVVGGPERVRMLLDRIYEQAMGGAPKQQELFLKYAGLLVDRRVTEVMDLRDVEELTDEEIQAEWDAEAFELLAENGLLDDDDE